jgi:cell division protease FtsH
VHKVSILQRGLALGYTLQLPQEDRYIMSRSELLERIAVFLGGRVSEELTFQEISTGAADDLKKATELARRMVTDFGMSQALGPISLGRKSEQPFLGRDLMEDRNYSEQVASAIEPSTRNCPRSSRTATSGLRLCSPSTLTTFAAWWRWCSPGRP